MAVTWADLADFNRFAGEKLASGTSQSLTDLVRQWEHHREYVETVKDVQAGIADVAAGRTKPIDRAFADIREKLERPE